jgi:NADH:ubiquinone reductase (H+-translocating)
MKENSKKKKILILGGGFAGVYSYLRLLKHDKKCNCVEVTSINKDDYFNFIVLSHEVATGGLMPSNTTQPIQELPRESDTDFMQAEITGIDFDKKTVSVKREDSICTDGGLHTHEENLSYDYAILGLGSESFSFGVPGVEEHALTLKSMQDAKDIKNRVLDSFETAQYCPDEALVQEMLTFVIVGGGPTGIELAGEMSDFIRGSLADIYPVLVAKAEMVLVQSADTLVPNVDKWFHDKASKILKNKQIDLLFNHRVTEIKNNLVITSHGEIKSRNVFWTAGVRAREIKMTAEKNIEIDERSRRIKVNDHLQVPGYENVYVAGDQAFVVNKETGQPYSMRAQFAVRQGQVAAHNIVSQIHSGKSKEFFWKDQGFIVSLGKGGALAKIFGIKFSGPFAWWVYRTAYLFKLVGIKAKLRTGLEWAISLIFSRDISKLS